MPDPILHIALIHLIAGVGAIVAGQVRLAGRIETVAAILTILVGGLLGAILPTSKLQVWSRRGSQSSMDMLASIAVPEAV